jgi:alkyl sulfatase BDS1-like metallo-beta-lactamase superfamily hydrolase
MNKGYTLDQLSERIPMPPYLIDDLSTIQTAKGNNITDPRDYLRAFYGSVPQSLRELYAGYLGWFQADPVALAPTPPQTYASKTVALMGGRNAVLAETKAAFGRGEYQWSAELATLLVTMNPQDALAREEKAKAFMQLGTPEINPNWRNWYLVAANELRGIYPKADSPAISGGLTSPGIVDGLPYETWVSQWSLRLKAEETIANNVVRSLGFFFGPSAPNQQPEGYVLKVRRGVAELISTGNTRAAVAAVSPFYIEMDKLTESKLIYADVAGKNDFPATLSSLLASGHVKVVGGTSDQVTSFFNLFDPPLQTLPPLAAR